MKTLAVYVTLLDLFAKGLELREITEGVNRKLKTNYLQSTISARIRDLAGIYKTKTKRTNGVKHVSYWAVVQ